MEAAEPVPSKNAAGAPSILTRIPEVGNRLQPGSRPTPPRWWRSRARAGTPPTPRSCCAPSPVPPGEVRRSWHAHNGTKGWTSRPSRGRQAQPRAECSGSPTRAECSTTQRPAAVRPARRPIRLPRLGQVALARLRLRRRHQLQPPRGHPAGRPGPPPGSVEGRQHLAAHGPWQRYVRVCRRTKPPWSTPADARPASAPRHRDGGQGRSEGVAAVADRAARVAPSPSAHCGAGRLP